MAQEFTRLHWAILFGCVFVFRGLWKYLSRAHAVVFVVFVGLAYLAKIMKPKDALDDEIQKLNARLAATADETGVPASTVRPTKFVIAESDRGLFTDRQRQYSSLLGGTQAQRRKFLRKKASTEGNASSEIDINDRRAVAALPVDPTPSVPSPPETAARRRPTRQFTDT
ncbi:Aste57867_9528 [Aphanomyces stellatus]|uniref:Aste57867_9528 protein n=1 Tax=Aphanomyces stellatus TaxID=120398 RepID=A0A485KN79_9STRA|nr:hypothetical protein As57867_009491 [Aphanomyces stellatus]VFT86407.1 Aste57867_9528 [Aphanomyces stellatus]